MKAVDIAVPSPANLVYARATDYLQLARPRLASLVLFIVAVSWLLAAKGTAPPLSLLHALAGTAMLFAGASALNQLMELHRDALMLRTANRPLPSGRLSAGEVLTVGGLLCAGGLAYLVILCPPVTAALAAFALVSYLSMYTPLKERTTLSTVIGAVPGAIPPMIGWTAATGSLDARAVVLFLIVFLWQIPHFLAIGWIYRDQYASAGFRVLPVVDPQCRQTGKQMVRYTVALIFVSLMPSVLGMSGWVSSVAALILGAMFLYNALAFARNPVEVEARRVFRMSLVYLPALFLVLFLNMVWVG
jgi:protoheme IX farnesyltransferase